MRTTGLFVLSGFHKKSVKSSLQLTNSSPTSARGGEGKADTMEDDKKRKHDAKRNKTPNEGSHEKSQLDEPLETIASYLALHTSTISFESVGPSP